MKKLNEEIKELEKNLDQLNENLKKEHLKWLLYLNSNALANLNLLIYKLKSFIHPLSRGDISQRNLLDLEILPIHAQSFVDFLNKINRDPNNLSYSKNFSSPKLAISKRRINLNRYPYTQNVLQYKLETDDEEEAKKFIFSFKNFEDFIFKQHFLRKKIENPNFDEKKRNITKYSFEKFDYEIWRKLSRYKKKQFIDEKKCEPQFNSCEILFGEYMRSGTKVLLGNRLVNRNLHGNASFKIKMF